MKGSDNQEKLVYQIIEDAGNKGNTLIGSFPAFIQEVNDDADELDLQGLFLDLVNPPPMSSCAAGIWSRDIRFKSNLPLTEINKILKNLESKKLIKAVKSVAVSPAAQNRWSCAETSCSRLGLSCPGVQEEGVHAVQPAAGPLGDGRGLVQRPGL